MTPRSSHCFTSVSTVVAVACLLSGLGFTSPACGQAVEKAAPALAVTESPDASGWAIVKGDRLVARYVIDSNGKPIIFPLVDPAGHHLTRNFPMKDALPSEKQDHDHHRSFWLTHGDVNGVDFWLDDDHCGKIVHRSGTAATRDDGSVVIQTENDWNGPDGKRILSDVRRFTFHDVGDRRIVDCDFLLKATDGDVNFGDTKEGSFGLRVAGTMKVDAKQGGKITNAEGEHGKEAWGKKSAWVDYSGPVDGDMVGITIHDHPESFGYPCRWHVRTYGLFAANPFGVYHFVGGDKTDGVVLKAGDEMRLSYRVVLHPGDLDAGQAAADSKAYAAESRPPFND